MSMNRKNILTNLKTTRGDEHGVTELLREVSQRSCSLTDEERREVSEMVRRVEEHHASKTPMGKFKKKLSENIHSINDTINESINDSIHTISNVTKGRDTGDGSGSKRGIETNSKSSSPSGAKNNWGKDLLEKMQNIELEKPWIAQRDPTAPKPDPKEVFRNFSEGIQNKLKLPQKGTFDGEKERRPEIMEAFKRSQQSGRDFMQNISKNIQNSLSPPTPPQANRATAKAVSNSLLASREIKTSNTTSDPGAK